jgi:hypothetical protein
MKVKTENRKKKLWKKIINPKINLIPSHVNCTFFILDLWIGPQAFKHTHCILRKNVFFMWRTVQFKVQYVGNWSLDTCLKWPLVCISLHFMVDKFHKWGTFPKCWERFNYHLIILAIQFSFWCKKYTWPQGCQTTN